MLVIMGNRKVCLEGIFLQYLHDVWVNWFEQAKDGRDVYHYHEWHKSDTFEVLEQVPLLFVSDTLYSYIENELSPLPNELIERVEQQTFIRKGYRRIRIDYVGVISDGRDILAFHTDGGMIPQKKSRLIPRQEQDVYKKLPSLERVDFSLPVEFDASKYEFNRNTIGLTRRERRLRQTLLRALERLKQTKNVSEMIYWFSEWDSRRAQTLSRDMPIEMMWQQLYKEVEAGWTKKHEEFCHEIVKVDPSLEAEWQRLQDERKNKLY